MAVKRRSDVTQASGRSPGRARGLAAPAPADAAAVSSTVVVGRLLSGSTASAPLVDFPGNGQGPVRARTTVPLDAAAIDRAVLTAQGVVLIFENADPALPIVTGLIWNGQSATPLQELLVSPRPGRAGRLPLEARLDGERVILEGKREIVLRCGDASITLRSDGRMVLRGAYVETHSKGLNRIKGASVKIN
jgi:hypothetical protein